MAASAILNWCCKWAVFLKGQPRVVVSLWQSADSGAPALLKELTSLDKLARAGELAQHIARDHPRRLAGVMVAVLVGISASAYGIASVGPDASSLPQQLLSQPLEIEGLESQLEALAGHRLDLARSEITRASDTADALLQRLGASDDEAASKLRTDLIARRVIEGRPGKLVRARIDQNGHVIELIARYPDDSPDALANTFKRLTLSRAPDGSLRSRIEDAELTPEIR